jgi:hypothetical protein
MFNTTHLPRILYLQVSGMSTIQSIEITSRKGRLAAMKSTRKKLKIGSVEARQLDREITLLEGVIRVLESTSI